MLNQSPNLLNPMILGLKSKVIPAPDVCAAVRHCGSRHTVTRSPARNMRTVALPHLSTTSNDELNYVMLVPFNYRQWLADYPARVDASPRVFVTLPVRRTISNRSLFQAESRRARPPEVSHGGAFSAFWSTRVTT
jgi:hypothetical protein